LKTVTIDIDIDEASPEQKKVFNMGMITVKAFLSALPYYERIDDLLAGVESRRASVLRDLDRRRDSFAYRLRMASDRIIDGEFAEHPQAAALFRPVKPNRQIARAANGHAKPAAA
jgi:hypothetical protein